MLTSCSKKTHISDTVQTSSRVQEIGDSIGQRNLLNIDRSVITTNTDLDTSISITGKPLSGSFNLRDSAEHFENDDLTIDFRRGKSGLDIAFKASPKTKIIEAHYHQKSVAQNNIIKTDDSQLSVARKTDIQRDSTVNHVADHRDPTGAMSNMKSTVIWIIILLIAGVIGFFILKRKLL